MNLVVFGSSFVAVVIANNLIAMKVKNVVARLQRQSIKDRVKRPQLWKLQLAAATFVCPVLIGTFVLLRFWHHNDGETNSWSVLAMIAAYMLLSSAYYVLAVAPEIDDLSNDDS